jgi:hypothetical protein
MQKDSQNICNELIATVVCREGLPDFLMLPSEDHNECGKVKISMERGLAIIV